MRKKILHFAIIIFILLYSLIQGVLFYMGNLYIPNATILRTAIKEKDLFGKQYILCKVERTTGFDWRVIKNEAGMRTIDLCNVIGSNPFELGLTYEFELADNTFIFYVEKKNTYYSDELAQEVIEYVATGWDILYPVKHDEYTNFFNISKFITVDDVEKETN